MDFVTVDRDTPMLLPPDLREWIHEDDYVNFVLEAVDLVDLSAFKVKRKRSGKKQYPPHMMLALLIYCYSLGIFSSRKIEAATRRDIYVRYLAGNTHPDHDTICTFRRENFSAISECFLQVLLLAKEMKLLKVGTIAVDGSHFKASASKDKNVTYERAAQLEAQLESTISDLMKKAETTDNEEVATEKLPEELKRRADLKTKMQQAQQELELRAKAQAEAQRPAYEAKVEARKERGGRGPEPKPPNDKPEGYEQCNLTDPDSRIMRKSKQGVTQSYNCQIGVDADGSQLIISHHISQCSADSGELEEAVSHIPEAIGKPQTVLADCGYVNIEAINRLQKKDYDVYVSVRNEGAQNQRKYDFRPQEAQAKQTRKIADPLLIDMREKLATEAGRSIYSKRQSSVEPTFGIIKQAMGFRQFLLRGLENVQGEWSLVCTAYNLKRLFNLKTA